MLQARTNWLTRAEVRGDIVVSTPAWHASVRGSIPCSDQAYYIWYKNLALNIRDFIHLCLSEETLKEVGPFYLVSIQGELKDPTQGLNV